MQYDIFHEIPKPLGDGLEIGSTMDCGGGVFNIDVKGSAFEDYQVYLETLEKNGFIKHVDNGLQGLEKCVWNSIYTKDEQVVTVIYVAKRSRMYIAVGKNIPLSKHLFYSDEYISDNCKDAKTRLHMPELYIHGNCFIIQLKNGHFVLDDSGSWYDAQYLLDYLETLVPEGEKPVVEGWFVSHGHGDHVGTFSHFVDCPEFADRVYVEGIYFSETSEEVGIVTKTTREIQKGLRGMQYCRTTSGQIPPIYRPQMGQRYYFNDFTIDVLHTQEQLPLQDYGTGYGINGSGFNDSSTWLMYTIEGQKFLHAGDAAEGSIELVKCSYEQDYLSFDIMATFHHGQNVYDCYVDYFNYKTVLYTTFVVGSQTAKCRREENERLQARAIECMSWGDGTKILTFPYQIGSAESLPLRVWIYHPERKIPKPF